MFFKCFCSALYDSPIVLLGCTKWREIATCNFFILTSFNEISSDFIYIYFIYLVLACCSVKIVQNMFTLSKPLLRKNCKRMMN